MIVIHTKSTSLDLPVESGYTSASLIFLYHGRKVPKAHLTLEDIFHF